MSQVTITAKNMLYAQGYKLEGEAREILTARADKHRARDQETDLQHQTVRVHDFDGAYIGNLTFML